MAKGFRFRKDKAQAPNSGRDADFSKLDEFQPKESGLEGASQNVDQEKKVSSEGDDQDLSQSLNVDSSEVNSSSQGHAPESEAELRAQVGALRMELHDATEKHLRALADFENFKKRAIKERSELQKYQGENLIVDLLEVLDNFERALENIDSDTAQFKEGVKLIHRMLGSVLNKHGIKAESAIGGKFEPQKHNALGQTPSDEIEAGNVVSELKKAYFYKDKLIRIGDVVVSSGKAASADSADSEQGKG